MDIIYYNSETPYYDTPNADKYESITNVSQLPNYYIKQPNSNEFIIKCNNTFFVILLFFLGSIGFLTILIYALIYDIGVHSYGGVIFGICLTGFFACMGLYGFLCYIVKQKIILTEDYIQIKNYHILCCINSNKKYNYIDIKSFEVDIVKENVEGNIVTKGYNINCCYNSDEKECFFDHNFGLEEAEYFVYVVNGFINRKKI